MGNDHRLSHADAALVDAMQLQQYYYQPRLLRHFLGLLRLTLQWLTHVRAHCQKRRIESSFHGLNLLNHITEKANLPAVFFLRLYAMAKHYYQAEFGLLNALQAGRLSR